MASSQTGENATVIRDEVKNGGKFWETYGVWLPIILIPFGMLMMVILSMKFGW